MLLSALVSLGVLVYCDDVERNIGNNYVTLALNDLGIPFSMYYDDCVGFGNALSSTWWDVVIVDHNMNFCVGTLWDSLAAYVSAGGVLMVSTYDVDGSVTGPTSLWGLMGVSAPSSFNTPVTLRVWDGSHPIFNVPNPLADSVVFEDDYEDDGDSVSAAFTAPAGFSPVAQAGAAAVSIRGDCKTLLNAFVVDEADGSADGDTLADAYELWENEIYYVFGCLGLGVAERPAPLSLRALPGGFVISRTAGGERVGVYDVVGRLVVERTLVRGENRFRLARGVYLVRLARERRAAAVAVFR